jgi:hypothetical protein
MNNRLYLFRSPQLQNTTSKQSSYIYICEYKSIKESDYKQVYSYGFTIWDTAIKHLANSDISINRVEALTKIPL